MMRENLFEMGADFEDSWSSDNKQKPSKQKSANKTSANRVTTNSSTEILTPQKHQLHLAKERRRGKVVTIVKPFCLSRSDLQALIKSLKKKLGTGGAIRDNSLEFQGDIPESIRTQLERLEYRFKK